MKAIERAKRLAEADLLQKPPLSKDAAPRSFGEVSELRKKDRELEAIAPSTGYTGLDRLITGFIPGRLYTMTGDTNVGKTALASNFTVRVAQQKKKVLYFALEPDRALVDYLLSASNKIRYSDITDDTKLAEEKYISIYGADQIDSVDKMIDAVERLDRFDLIVVDHIGYFVKNDSGNLYAEQGDVLKQLALLAQRKQSAILIVAHLNKSANVTPEDWIPNMNQISGSASFKQDSDDVLIVARKPIESDDEYKFVQYTNEGAIAVNKTKAGRSGLALIKFNDASALIEEPSKPEGVYEF